MIWAFEYLTEKQKQDLKYLNPFMDFMYSRAKMEYNWKTFCAGYENGKEIRRIRLFQFEQIRQGFICDDFYEAINLCAYLESPQDEWNIEWMQKNHLWIPDYLTGMKESKFKHWLDNIAIPVTTFIKYYQSDKMLDLIDLNSLMNK